MTLSKFYEHFLAPFIKIFAKVLGFLLALSIFALFLTPSKERQGFKTPHFDKVQLADHNGIYEKDRENYVLAIDISGEIGSKNINAQQLENRFQYIQKQLKHTPKALLLLINTPGGVGTEGHALYRSLIQIKKNHNLPVYAYVDGLCASAGFYVTSSCDKVFSTPLSLIGSIGAKIETFNFYEGMRALGIHYRSIESGANKSALHPFLPLKKEEEKDFQSLVKKAHHHLVGLVTEARPQVSKKTLIDELGAKLLSPSEAEYIGLIDEANADYSTALKQLTQQAGIQGPYVVIKLDPKGWEMGYFMESVQQLIGGWQGSSSLSIGIR